MKSENCVTFATLNARGIGARKKQIQLKRLLLEEGIDMLTLQETKLACDDSIERALEPFIYEYEVCVGHAVGFSAGCFMFLKKTLPLTNLNVVTGEETRFILGDFALFSSEYRVIGVYATNDVPGREFFFNKLMLFVDTDTRVVFIGDFNVVCAASDRSRLKVFIDRNAKFVEDLTDECDLVDAGTLTISSESL